MFDRHSFGILVRTEERAARMRRRHLVGFRCVCTAYDAKLFRLIKAWFLSAMSYRRTNEQELNWREWLRGNERSLSECGLPELVFSSEAHWWDFLMHGYLDHHEDQSNFIVEDLSLAEMKCLKAFLESELTSEERRSAIVLLQLCEKIGAGE